MARVNTTWRRWQAGTVGRTTALCLAPAVFAVYIPMCAPKMQPTAPPWDAHMAEFWEKPTNLEARDLFYGPWGPERAPDARATYTFVAKKQTGTNPGVTVADPHGREWSVKQPPQNHQGAEGPIEVVLSRVLSAVGYHQPPVYFLPSFTMTDQSGTREEPGGRFRLKVKSLKKQGDWLWQQNPFVGTKPYQGLLVILMMFDSSDLKNVNNTRYELTASDEVDRWYVVRDLGTALGETARLHPKRGNPDIFEREAFITGVKDGFVEFNYRGWHKELVRHRITPEEVHWACDLLAGLGYQQWTDAFRAGGYEPAVAERFIRRLLAKVAEGERVGLPPPRLSLFGSAPSSIRVH
jgi:hypothetical protein